jgi:hypothetical protein
MKRGSSHAHGGRPSGRGKGAGGAVKRRRAASDSESEDAEPMVKWGCALGAVKWQPEDFNALLDLGEDLLPAGKKEWLALYARFAEWAVDNGWPVHSAETIEKRYKLVRPLGSYQGPQWY